MRSWSTAPQGFKVVPGRLRRRRSGELGAAEHLGLVQAFSALAARVDILIVDTAAGIAHSVLQFSQAAQHVLRGHLRRAGFADRRLRADQGAEPRPRREPFRVVANQVRVPGDGAELFQRFERVTARFLDVVLEYAGEIPEDEFLRRSVREQRPVLRRVPVQSGLARIQEIGRAGR